MKCAQHPNYTPSRLPRKTTMHPDGCPTCLGLWESAKFDTKKHLKTVNIELSQNEARTLVLALDMVMKKADPEAARPLQPFYMMVMRALKEVL